MADLIESFILVVDESTPSSSSPPLQKYRREEEAEGSDIDRLVGGNSVVGDAKHYYIYFLYQSQNTTSFLDEITGSDAIPGSFLGKYLMQGMPDPLLQLRLLILNAKTERNRTMAISLLEP